MASHNHEPMLPKVEESDLLGLVVEEVTDPEHTGWWKAFATDNPILARQVLKRAYFDTQHPGRLSSLELQQVIVNNISFVVRALKIAAERRAGKPLPEEEVQLDRQSTQMIQPIDGDGDGEDPPLSA